MYFIKILKPIIYCCFLFYKLFANHCIFSFILIIFNINLIIYFYFTLFALDTYGSIIQSVFTQNFHLLFLPRSLVHGMHILK